MYPKPNFLPKAYRFENTWQLLPATQNAKKRHAKRKKIQKNRRIIPGKLHVRLGLFAFFIYTNCSFSSLSPAIGILESHQLPHFIEILQRDYNWRFNRLKMPIKHLITTVHRVAQDRADREWCEWLAASPGEPMCAA